MTRFFAPPNYFTHAPVVFEVGTIADADFRQLSLLGKVKSLAHRKRTALLPKLDACHACGMCVVACPEKALSLRPAR